MFATLLGALPLPDVDGDADPTIDGLVEAAVRAQEVAGFEPITDGRLRDAAFERLRMLLATDVDTARTSVVDAWRTTAALTDRAVKQAVPGPYSLGWLADGGGGRPERTLAFAEALRSLAIDLATAGCPLVEIEETEAHRIGADEDERRLFRDAHRRLAEGVGETHLSLSLVGGSAGAAGIETIADAPYSSLAVDLVNGPDNWNLVTRLPRERGVVAGVLPARKGPTDAKELLLWAARYASVSGGRGLDRVGLGSAGSWANLTWAAAVARLDRLGEAARLASMPRGDDLARSLDPKSVSIRRAALGHDVPRPPRRRRRPKA